MAWTNGVGLGFPSARKPTIGTFDCAVAEYGHAINNAAIAPNARRRSSRRAPPWPRLAPIQPKANGVGDIPWRKVL